jgi:hypothetical protein
MRQAPRRALDRRTAANAEQRMRFRGAAYIVARVCTTGMQQGRLWICSLLPDSHERRGMRNKRGLQKVFYAKSTTTTMPVDGKSLMGLLEGILAPTWLNQCSVKQYGREVARE